MFSLFRSLLGKNGDAATKVAGSKKPLSAKQIRKPENLSPFLAEHTKSGLVSRFAEQASQRREWMLISVLLVVLLGCSLGLNIYQSTQAKFIPFKVVVDAGTGALLDKGIVEPMKTVEDVYIRRELREILKGLRTVYSDQMATEQSFLRAYNHIVQNSPADAYLKDYFAREGNHPLSLQGLAQRSVVEIAGPSHMAGTRTWAVQWVERTAHKTGEVTEDVYRGSITFNSFPVDDVETANKNPLGIFVDGWQWEKVSSKVIDLSKLDDLSPMDLLYPDARGKRK